MNPGKHYGLVGANGSGKSTLLKILSNELTPEAGSFSLPCSATLGTLKQNHYLYENTKILDVVLMGKEKLFLALSEKEKLLQESHFTEKTAAKLEELEEVIAKENGYQAPSNAAKLLEGLGIKENVHDKPLSILSGGYKLRVLMAQTLFSNPDILLLDEPTNHLDIFSIDWLQGYLKNFPGTILLSSHDKEFLNQTSDFILDVDHGTIKLYKGNFDTFIEAKAFDLSQKQASLEKQEKKKEHLQAFITRFGAKATKATQAQSKAKLVEKLEDEMQELFLSPTSRLYPHFHFVQERPSGAIALKADAISKNYDEKQVLKNTSFQIQKSERVALLGENGIGKSTLLEILFKGVIATEGTFEWGHAAKAAYFPQDHKKEIKGDETLLEWLSQYKTAENEQQLRDLLGKVLFTGDDAKKKTALLSGGEAARLIIAKMMLQKSNVLVFDEPTNHLDMEAIEALLDALQDYPGTLLFVSHNRYFISKIATRIIEITKDGILDFPGSYENYLEKRQIDHLSAKSKAKEMPSAKKQDQKTKFEEEKQARNLRSQMEKKLLQAEKKCHTLETKLKEITAKLSEEGFYQNTPKIVLENILKEKESAELELEKYLLEWETIALNLQN